MDGNVGDLAGVLGGAEKKGRRPRWEAVRRLTTQVTASKSKKHCI